MFIPVYNTNQIKKDRLLRARAAELRRSSTAAEVFLWKYLHAGKLGYRFRRQHALHGYIVDFYCYQLKLIIEVDGPVHEAHEEHDHIRDQLLSSYGFKTLRFTNQQVLENIINVLYTIQKYIALNTLSPE